MQLKDEFLCIIHDKMDHARNSFSKIISVQQNDI
jgi:hypothetical protein